MQVNGQVWLGVRYGWLAKDIVDLSLLKHPPVQLDFPRQVFWQKDLCADGQRHVTGKLLSAEELIKKQTAVAALFVK